MTDAAHSSPEDHASTAAPLAGRIVVGVDGSDGSLAALTWALTEARLRDVAVHAVIGWTYHSNWGFSGLGSMFPKGYSPSGGALPGGLQPSMPSPADTAQSTEAEAAEAAVNRVLEAAISQAVQQDAANQPSVTITSEAIPGHAAKVLLDAATESDLLVVGSRGHGGFLGALLGSVSQHVVSQARCPVIIVPDPQRTG